MLHFFPRSNLISIFRQQQQNYIKLQNIKKNFFLINLIHTIDIV